MSSEAMPFFLAGGAGLVGLLLVLALASLSRTSRKQVAARVEALSHATPYARATDQVELLRSRGTFNVPFVDLGRRTRAWIARNEAMLDRAGSDMRVGEYLTQRAFALAVGGLLGTIFARVVMFPISVVIVPAGVLGYLVPRLMLWWRIRKRQRLFESQLIELCDLMAAMLRSGFGYLQALTTTADQVGAPLGNELLRVVDEVRLGRDIDEAFEAMNDRIASADFLVLTTAMSIQRRTGGNLAEILDGVADTIRDRQSLRQEIKALVAMEQTTAAFAVLFPLGLAVALIIMSPDPYRMLVNTPTGRLLLGAALAMDAVGYVVMRRVTKLEP